MYTVDDTCDKRNCHYNLKSSPENLTSLTTRREMTSVFRELPSNYWLLLVSTEESQIYSDVYEKDSNSKSPTSLSKLLENSPILTNANLLEEFILKRTPLMDCWTSFVKPCLRIIMFSCTSHNQLTQKQC